MSDRRQFIKSFSAASISPFLINSTSLINFKKRLKASLNPGAIGLKCSPKELLDFAIKYEFNSISPLIGDLLKLSESNREAYLSKMRKNKITFDSAGLPIEFRTSELKFRDGFEFLKNNINKIVALNISSFVTWIMPTHKSLTYNKNFFQHRTRLNKIASLLENSGLKLGLEYVGPKTLVIRDKYPFLHSISELKELIEAIGKNNIGYLLDSFHTYCAEDKLADLDFLNGDDIISVQLNDGVLGRSVETQMDLERELPGDTKIIDIKAFINFIRSKGYEGPVSVEPFNNVLNKMDANKKLQRVRESLQRFSI